MAKAPDPFHEFVCELFSALGPITVKRMFGGAGAYTQGVMFALVGDGEIYVKADAALRAELAEEGCGPFLWTRATDGRVFDLGYVALPSSAMDDSDEACVWGRKALACALKAKAAKAKPATGRKTRAGK